VLAKQALYPLSHSASPFWVGYFSNRVLLYICVALFSHVAGTTTMTAVGLDGVLSIFSRLALNLDSPDLHLMSS
jgi:hypothetical protein